MISDSALAAYDAQVRRSPPPDGVGAVVEAGDAIVRSVAPAGLDGSSWITWSGLDASSADAVIAAQVDFFGARNQTFEWKLYDYDQPADLGARLTAAGLQAGEAELVMVAEATQVGADVALPAGLTVREVTGAAGVGQLIRVGEQVFGTDKSPLRQALLAQAADSPQSLGMVIAFAGDEPVCAARVEFPATGDFAGLWGGGTLPAWRGRGLYRALVGYRAAMAAARGYRYVQVDALPTSQPILTRLGFRSLARTTPYVWEPGVSAPSAAADTLRD